MNAVSVVIITLNEEENIADCIHSAKMVSDDIVIVDSGSRDQTLNLAHKMGANIISVDWKGYGFSRNYGAVHAKNDWILALDADERISTELAYSIRQLEFIDVNRIYHFRRFNYLGSRRIRFGTLGFENVKRIYNRKFAQWDLTLVHEKLESWRPLEKGIAGHISHYGLKSEKDYKAKAILYGQLSAEKYFNQGKRITLVKKYGSPLLNSVKSYIFQFGFLDGHTGWIVARTIGQYSWLKYFYLTQLWKESKIKEYPFSAKHKIEKG